MTDAETKNNTWKERRFAVIDEWKSRKPPVFRDYLYLAYGSNLNKQQMLRRCPNAVPLKGVRIKDLRLVFRGVADIEEHEGSYLDAGLWRITNHCEWELDVYEGYRKNGGGLYDKTFFEMSDGTRAMVYFMKRGGSSPPSPYYFNTILEGYRDFELPQAGLYKARRVAELLALPAPDVAGDE